MDGSNVVMVVIDGFGVIDIVYCGVNWYVEVDGFWLVIVVVDYWYEDIEIIYIFWFVGSKV